MLFATDASVRAAAQGGLERLAERTLLAAAPLVERGQAAGRAAVPAIRRELAAHKERVQREVDASLDGALHLVLRA